MSSFPKIVAHIFLLLQCLTPRTYEAHVKDDLKEVFTRIKRIKIKKNQTSVESVEWPICGAAWIDKDYLISAASCLDNNGENELHLRLLMHNYLHVKVFTNLTFPDDPHIPLIGRGVAHPLYQRDKKNRFPIAYDVALFKVDFGQKQPIFHAIADLCPKIEGYRQNHNNSAAVALRVYNRYQIQEGKVREYKLLDYDDNETFWNNKWYCIDRSKQFVTILNDPHKFRFKKVYRDHIFWYTVSGVPIFSENPKEPKRRCISGIMSSRARYRKQQYVITSTKVDEDDLIDWVEHTKLVLLDQWERPTKKGAEKFERSWWKKEFIKQQIGINGTYVNGTVKFIQAGSPCDRKM